MTLDGSTLGLVTATFLASTVELVEAFTIVLAMGVTREWRSTLIGAGAALATLAALTAAAGATLVDHVPQSALRLVIGSLLLVFGLQWLRKAILRAAGHKALHDEDEIFRSEREAAHAAGDQSRHGLDWLAFTVSFKGVLLEGIEVVFIVITFGLNAGSIPIAAAAAGAAAVVVLAVGVLVRAPLSRVPENTLKFAVGLLLTTFGTFWAVEGLGTFEHGGGSVDWPGGELALLALLGLWLALASGAVRVLRASAPAPAGHAS